MGAVEIRVLDERKDQSVGIVRDSTDDTQRDKGYLSRLTSLTRLVLMT
jgi:hypothetical protein